VEGWVSIRLATKELMRRQDSPRRAEAKGPNPFEGGARLPRQLQEKAEAFCIRNSRETCTPLPRDALDWEDRECELWFRTDGMFHPRIGPKGKVRDLQGLGFVPKKNKDRVTIICPTVEGRQAYHEFLWYCFETQDWPNKELVVIETYLQTPSPFFTLKAQEDSRVIFLAFQLPSQDADFSIGLKRNICIHLGTGQYVAHFDDDDLYAPDYLSVMVGQLQEDRSAHAITLSTWYMEEALSGEFAYCNPKRAGWRKHLDENHAWVKEHLYGFGFSYVYRRSFALKTPFADWSKGEDYDFYSKILKYGEGSVLLLEDRSGICLHVQHASSMTDCKPCKNRKVGQDEIEGLSIAISPAFGMCVQLAQLTASADFFDQNPTLGHEMLTTMAAGLSKAQLAALAARLEPWQQTALSSRLKGEALLEPEFTATLAKTLTKDQVTAMGGNLSEVQKAFLVGGMQGIQPLFTELADLVQNLGDEQLSALGAAVGGFDASAAPAEAPTVEVEEVDEDEERAVKLSPKVMDLLRGGHGGPGYGSGGFDATNGDELPAFRNELD